MERINTFVADETAVTLVIADTTGEKALNFLPLLFVLFGLGMLVKGACDFATNYRSV